ncbi:hypothetical protein AB1N83_014208, partial [Pleurotus pulmonarius]
MIAESRRFCYVHPRFSLVGNGTLQPIFGLSAVLNKRHVWPLAIEYFQPENCYLKKEPNIFY